MEWLTLKRSETMYLGPRVNWDADAAAQGLRVTSAQHCTVSANGRKAAWLVTDWLACNTCQVTLVPFETGFLLYYPNKTVWQPRMLTDVLALSRSVMRGAGRAFNEFKQRKMEYVIGGWIVVDCRGLPHGASSWWINQAEATEMQRLKVLGKNLSTQREKFLKYAAVNTRPIPSSLLT